LNHYFEELINRSISNIRSFYHNVWKPKRLVGRISKRTSTRYRIRRV